MNQHPFLQGLFDLFGVGRHLFAGAAVGDVDLTAAQAHAGAGRIHGGIAAADDHHLIRGLGLSPRFTWRKKEMTS